MLLRGISSSTATSLSSTVPLSWRPRPIPFLPNPKLVTFSLQSLSPRSLSACSSTESSESPPTEHSKSVSFSSTNLSPALCLGFRAQNQGGKQSFCYLSAQAAFLILQAALKPGLYLVGTPIGNLEDISFRALRVLRSANVILSEDTRHSGKLLRYYDIKTPLLSYHKFNESQREHTVLNKLRGGEVVALISDAGMPGISDPGTELAKLCVKEDIPVIPIPGPSAVVAALSASGLNTEEFTFVGFLPKHSGTRRERLLVSANQATTQIFFVPPHKLLQFLEEACSIFSDSRRCVIAREITKIHEEAVKMVAEATSVRKKTVYTLALQKFGKQLGVDDDSI
ncbi:hypothetical protein CDL15_Pgr021382 [Punica granatum]|uniref:Tetrapyrrole methylase domain-containing protein n=1 Tax=Punica granatum TaxID=22663 RepID=A0A218WS27_PUNGR|nr:hypothetical protein CDL15_Pgr021382 [Punica granatum]